MATGGVTSSEKDFKLKCGICVKVLKGDVFQTTACAIAIGEDLEMKGYGAVSTHLKQVCPKEYNTQREMLKTRTREFEFGSVHLVDFKDSQSRSKQTVSFNSVYHAIVPVQSKSSDWHRTMLQLYRNLIRKVNTDGKGSLALPLLGSGGAGGSFEAAAEVLVEALTTFRPENGWKKCLKHIFIYARDPKAFETLVTKFSEHLSSAARSGRKDRPKPKSLASTDGKIRPAYTKYASSNSRTKHGGFPNEMSNLSTILGDMNIRSGDQDDEEAMDTDNDDLSSVSDEEDEKNGAEVKEEEDRCAICLDTIVNPKTLVKCSHTFCKECIESSFQNHRPVCPTCNTIYGLVTGNQPKGDMKVISAPNGLPGYQNCGTLIIDYSFPSGIQGKEHPNPGQVYRGTHRRAYLPDCSEGRKVCELLKVAFDKRLIFTVGRSRTTGADNVVTWNDIHHKTSMDGGTAGFGYPDAHYLSRVQEELAAKGVTAECLTGRTF